MSFPPAIKLDLDSFKLSKSVKAISQDDKPGDDVLTARLGSKAKSALNASPNTNNYSPYLYLEWIVEDLVVENKSSIVTSRSMKIKVHSVFSKLFEGVYIDDVEESVAKYMFSNVIGWDNYFNCPVIILQDTAGAVVDIIKYRPNRTGYDKLSKYLQINNIDKPTNRGKAFLYPFQIEMERLIKQEQFVIVGEGLKNAVNALMLSVPYISIESTSNTNNQKLIDYINNLDALGIEIHGALDGDAPGKTAFNTLNEKFNFKLINLFDLNSGLDFTDYVRKE